MRVAAIGRAALACAALLAAAPAGAQADTAVGLVGANGLVIFDTAAPTTGLSFRAITGLGANQSVRGIDVRPANGLLYATAVTTGSVVNSPITTYTIDPATGAATLVGATAPVPAAADVATGLDFNPVADRLRYVNVNDENARTNPNNGTLAGDDPNITPALTADVIGVAYDRNVLGATLTTAYVLNRATSRLGLLGGIDGTPSPNGGVVTDLGPLGVTLGPIFDGGFDISPAGVAYAAMTTTDNTTRLYTIDLATGAATAVGPIGLGTSPIDSLAILPPAAAPPPPPPPPPAIAPAPPPADRAAPKVLVTASSSARLTPTSVKAIRIDFSCNEACLAAGTLRVGATTIASRSLTLRGADVARLRLATTIAQRNAIGRLKRAGRRRTGVLTLTFTDGAGNRRKITRTVRLRPSIASGLESMRT